MLLLGLFSKSFSQVNPTISSDSIARYVQMNEVVLTAKRLSLRDQLVNFFRANQSSTLEEIMARLPELSMIRRGSYGMEPSVRSFSSGQINLLVDGMKIHGACTDKMDPPTIYIEPSNLDNLSVQSTAQGISKGSSIGGTINMQLQEPKFETSKTTLLSVSSGYQSAANSLFQTVRVNHNIGNWAFLSSATLRKTNNYRAGGGEKINFSQYSKVNYSFSALHKLGQRSSIKFDLIGDDGWNIGYASLPMDVGYAAARIISSTMKFGLHSRTWEEVKVKLYTNSVHHYMDDTHRPNVAMHMDMPGKSGTTGFFVESSYRKQKKNFYSFRVDGSQTRLYASMTMYQAGQLPMYMLTWPNNNNNQMGVSSSLTHEIDSAQKLILTIRVDAENYVLTTEEARDHMAILNFQQRSRSFFLKNLSVSYLNKNFQSTSLTGSISYSERSPTSSELFGFYLYNALDGYDHMGNPILKKEDAFQAEASINYSKPKINFQATVFTAFLTNMIRPILNSSFHSMTIGAPGVKQYTNIGGAYKAGIESVVSASVYKNLVIVNSLRYWVGAQNNGDPIPLLSPLRNVIALKKSIGSKFIQIENEFSAAQNRFNVAAGEDATAAYSLFHLRFQSDFSIGKSKCNLQVGVENIFDKRYNDHLDWNNTLRPGRNGYVLVNFRF